MPKDKKGLLFFLLGAVFVGIAFICANALSVRQAEVAKVASARLSLKANQGVAAAKELAAGNSSRVFADYHWLFAEEQLGLYVFANDSLVGWNNSQVPFRYTLSEFPGSHGLATLNTGIYFYAKEGGPTDTVLMLLVIKPKYELQNRYLSHDFAPWLGIPNGIGYSPSRLQDKEVLYGKTFLFSLEGSEDLYTSVSGNDLCLLLLVIGLAVLMCGVISRVKSGASVQWVMAALAIIFLLRASMLFLHWPVFLYGSKLYDVRIFGNADSPVNGYLGDMLLNTITLLMWSALLFVSAQQHAQRYKFLYISLTTILLSAVSFQLNDDLKSLVTNSTLSFNFLDFMNLSGVGLLALSGMVILALAFYVLCGVLMIIVPAGKRGALFIIVLLVFPCATIFLTGMGDSFLHAIWPMLAGMSAFAASRLARGGPMTTIGVFVLVMSALSSSILNSHLAENEKTDLEVLSIKLGERQDAVLEHEYVRIPADLSADASLNNLLRIMPSTAEAIRELLGEKYFSGYFRRYNIEYSLFDEKCYPRLATTDPLLLNEGYLTDQISRFSDSTSAPGLYFVRNYKENARYIAQVVLGDYRLYVLMQPKQFEEIGSFPELLLDESQQKHDKLKGFSYVVYRNSQNTSSYGNLNYPPFLPDSSRLSESEPGFTHWFFSPDEDTQVVISRQEKTWTYFFTFNSYMLLLFSVLSYLLYFLYTVFFELNASVTSLTRRIQAIIILLLLLAITAVGVTSGRLVREQFSSENKKELREKTAVIYTELSGLYTAAQLFDPGNRDAVGLKLNEYARIFNTDISLFDAQGFLYATSQPRLYALGLSAPLAHPKAMTELRDNVAAAVTIREKAGSLSYLSLYTALYQKASRHPAGFINLPYFARQSDLVSELSGIINGLVNVYVILFIVSIAAGLILAGYITRPLRLIQQQISGISLGKKNEKIQWQSNDELGKLIAEYNQMLVKLEESAEKLARSERESAWREMAKQVAHEIKNPLTPMKLNLQYLQHLLQNDPEAFREKFGKASAGIIEQIDSLANIANEFSNFAQLPQSQVQEINIIEVISSAMLLFESRDRVSLRNRIPEECIMVKGDRDQCLRVFNNLFTNAVQALEDTHEPWIEIGRVMKPEAVVIQIRDNGSGIDGPLKSKIFTPNFTTKNTGSGLGLAMVKNIMEGFGGKVWFESEKGLGTVFYLEFKQTENHYTTSS